MRWLLDEMVPPRVAIELERIGHEAWSVHTVGLVETPDVVTLGYAADRAMVVVTENRNDFQRLSRSRILRAEPAATIVIIRKGTLPRGDALPFHLARRLDRWAARHPNPALIPYWLPAEA